MKVRDIQQFLSRRMGRQAGEIDQRIRPLRAAGLLDFGPRGDRAPVLSIAEAAYVVASMIARRAADALPVAVKFMSDCRYVEHPRHGQLIDYRLPHGTQAALFLMVLLAHPDAFEVDGLEISEDGTRAWLTILRDGALERLYFSVNPDGVRDLVDGDERVYRHQGVASVGGRFFIGGGALEEMALKLSAANPAAEKPELVPA